MYDRKREVSLGTLVLLRTYDRSVNRTPANLSVMTEGQINMTGIYEGKAYYTMSTFRVSLTSTVSHCLCFPVACASRYLTESSGCERHRNQRLLIISGDIHDMYHY